MQNSIDFVMTPPRSFSLFGALLGGKALPALAARLALRLSRMRGGPLKFRGAVFAIRHQDVDEVLRRDLDFLITPVNANRIKAVNGGAFILGMDRAPQHMRERAALYAALSRIDIAALADRAKADVAARLAARSVPMSPEARRRSISALSQSHISGAAARARASIFGSSPIKAGARVIAFTQAAMHDPDAFPDPAEMQPDRPMAAYLHFGGGLHPCAGRVINAIQIPLLVGTLLDVGATPDGAMKWAGPFPDRMPVRIDKGAAR